MNQEVHFRTIRELMNSTDLELPKIFPIRVWDDRPEGATWILPSMDHISQLSTLWIVLNQIVCDWTNYAKDYTFDTANDNGVSKAEYLYFAFQELEPRFINCLFSYINFFFLIENGLDVMFDEIRALARELSITIKIPKKPRRSKYLDRLRMVRNHTVVHWGGPKNKNDIDSRAGRMWGFSFPVDADSIEQISFGNSSLQGATDRRLHTIKETHLEASVYLQKYDLLCAQMLREIIGYLPLQIGTRRYINTDPNKKE